MQTCIPPNKRGRKKRAPPPTERDRRAYHDARLRNYRLSLTRAPRAVRIILQTLIDVIERER